MNRLIAWLIGKLPAETPGNNPWLIDWIIYRLIDWLFNLFIVLIDWLMTDDWQAKTPDNTPLIDWLIDRQRPKTKPPWLIDLLINWWLTGRDPRQHPLHWLIYGWLMIDRQRPKATPPWLINFIDWLIDYWPSETKPLVMWSNNIY